MEQNKTKKCISGVLSLCTAVCLCVGGTFFAPTTTTAKAEALTLDSSLIKLTNGVSAENKTHSAPSEVKPVSNSWYGMGNSATGYTLIAGKKNTSNSDLKFGGSYSGLTVESEAAYESGFDGTFTGDTTIQYKFPGFSNNSAAVSSQYGYYFRLSNYENSKHTYAYNIGDAQGDFYFKVTSISNPLHTFTYKMGANSYGVAYAEYKNGNATYYSMGRDDQAGKVLHSSNSAHITSSKNAVDFNYFNNDTVSNPCSFKFYKNSSNQWSLNVTYWNRSKMSSSPKAWYSTLDILTFGKNSDSITHPSWDFSDGYTIEFGSNYATGTDICFINVDANYTANATESYSAKFVGLDGVELDTTCAAGETVTLPEGTNYNGETFVGWDIGGELYPAGYSWTVPADLTEDMTVNAVGVAFGIVDGASVRKVTTDNGKGGLRFTGHIATADAVANVAYGTYLNGVQVLATKVLTPTSAEGLMKEDYVADNTYFTAVITDLDSANYETDVTAETYIIVTYADGSTKEFKSVSVTRNAKQVAERALDAGETGDMLYEYAGREKPVENN